MNIILPEEKLICQYQYCKKSLIKWNNNLKNFSCQSCHVIYDFDQYNLGLEGWCEQYGENSQNTNPRVEYNQSSDSEENDYFDTKAFKNILRFLKQKTRKFQPNEQAQVQKRFYQNINKYTNLYQKQHKTISFPPLTEKILNEFAAYSTYQVVVNLVVDNQKKILEKILRKFNKINFKKFENFMKQNKLPHPQIVYTNSFSQEEIIKPKMVTDIEKFGYQQNFTQQNMKLLRNSIDFIRQNELFDGQKFSVIACGALFLVGNKNTDSILTSYNSLHQITGVSKQACKKYVDGYINKNEILQQFLGQLSY